MVRRKDRRVSSSASPVFAEQFLTGIRRLLQDQRAWLAIYVIVIVVATAVCVVRVCNNYLIFRAATDHLLAGADLYAYHPARHVDLYKYSPTFALAFAPFAWLPFAPSLLVWNALNVLLIFAGLRLVLGPTQRLAAIQLVGVALITTIDGTQSNGLVAALMLFAFAAYERGQLVGGGAAIAGGALVKIFPLAALAFLLPRPDRVRAAVVFAVVFAGLVALPVLVTPVATLIDQYRSWYAMGSVDALDRGASVMRLLHDGFGYEGRNWPVQLAGTVLLLLPLVRRPGAWADADFRRQFLASLLVYSVIFNHKAEQPSFIIALTGVAVWYAVGARTWPRAAMVAATLVATVPILMTVIAPGIMATDILVPLKVASACCTLVWITQQAELLDLLPVAEPTIEPEPTG